MKEIKSFDGHIILLCKNHYKCSSLIEGLRMIWAIRCGYEYNSNDHSIDTYIANKLYNLLIECGTISMKNLQERIHDDITHDWKFNADFSPIERLIFIYCCELAFIQVREKKDNKWIDTISLPKPKKKLFNRILKGKGVYNDYWLVESKPN